MIFFCVWRSQAPGANRERWSATINLINGFYLPLREQDRMPVARIAAAEDRLGIRLPVALREVRNLIQLRTPT